VHLSPNDHSPLITVIPTRSSSSGRCNGIEENSTHNMTSSKRLQVCHLAMATAPEGTQWRGEREEVTSRSAMQARLADPPVPPIPVGTGCLFHHLATPTNTREREEETCTNRGRLSEVPEQELSQTNESRSISAATLSTAGTC
jgi:hypothetical protein